LQCLQWQRRSGESRGSRGSRGAEEARLEKWNGAEEVEPESGGGSRREQVETNRRGRCDRGDGLILGRVIAYSLGEQGGHDLLVAFRWEVGADERDAGRSFWRG
jgi:hypothetical protein